MRDVKCETGPARGAIAPSAISHSALLLAGGKSTRMGRDKAFVEIDGMPLWRRQMEILQSLSPAEIFIAGPENKQWSGFPTICDAAVDAGPLAGIIAGLRRCAAPHLLVLAVDMPKMSAVFFATLLEQCTPARGVVACGERGCEPLAAVYPREILPFAEARLAAGKLSLQPFITAAMERGLLHAHRILPDERILFSNVNTPADMANLSR